VTFTIDKNNAICGNCTFTGGNVVVTKASTCQGCSFSADNVTVSLPSNKQFNLQGGSTTTFNGTTFSGTGGGINLTGPATITNSTFNFSGSSFFNNNGTGLTVDNSNITFANSTYLLSNAPVTFQNSSNLYLKNTASVYSGNNVTFNNHSSVYLSDNSNLQSSGTVTLQNDSYMGIGDGPSTSGAYVYLSGTLTLWDNSTVGIANNNNYFAYSYTGGSYTYNSGASTTTYSTASLNYNCNGTYPNACQNSYVYGCATFSKTGPAACTILALNSPDLSAATTGSNLVILSWSAGPEVNADHFVVERSVNGQGWSAIGKVSTTGYASLTTSYSYRDEAAMAGINNYRLVTIDKDGRSIYSKIIPVNISSSATNTFGIYPNPITGRAFHLKTASPEPVLINIHTISGQLLSLISLKGQTQYDLTLPPNTPGHTYLIIQVIAGDKTRSFTVLNE